MSACEIYFRGNIYKPIAWIEHLVEDNNRVQIRHYITYRQMGGQTVLFDDSDVAFKAREILNNTDVVLVVMRSIGSITSPTVLSDKVSNSPVACENTPAITNKQNLQVKNRRKKRRTN